MEPDPPAGSKIVQKIVCPICGAEGKLILPSRDPERCVALQRVRCDSCGIERTIFLKFPDEEQMWEPQ
ncbi:MAG: hypothetical protein HY278_06070 [candidate division NC10 bacterium]|jgi:transposase-like protein|nr:hypothetical protein [candidate division NC10 bacterium]